ncbi:hypothetical protein FOZ63_001358, partial [Perkinsus olseni]
MGNTFECCERQNSEEQLELPRSARGRKANTFDSLPSLAGDDSKDQEDAGVLPSPVGSLGVFFLLMSMP